MSNSTLPPTPRQLAYLKALAEQTATSFAYPKTRSQASQQIERLKQLKQHTGARAPEPRDHDDRQLIYATAPADEEIAGWGSNAAWRAGRQTEGRPAAQPPDAKEAEQRELARYRVAEGERVLYSQRVNGALRIIDRPATGAGRSYLVERELEHDGPGAVQALTADYLAQARKLDRPPVGSSVVRHELEQLAA